MERPRGKCPIQGCNAGAMVKKTRTGEEYFFQCDSGKHRGFVTIDEVAVLNVPQGQDLQSLIAGM